MDAALEAAFRETHYRVSVSHGELVLRIDRYEPALVALLREADASCAALLTAFNPGGHLAAPFHNRWAQRRLRVELTRTGSTVLVGSNEDPRHRWPVESSALALGLPLIRAHEIATRFGQVAFLWIEADGRPRLMATATRRRRS